MPFAPRFHKRTVSNAPSLRARKQARAYDAVWRRTSKHWLAEHPVCYCYSIRVWTPDGEVRVQLGEGIRPARCTDHVRPLETGGADGPENYQSLCWSCHSRKTVLDQHPDRIPKYQTDELPETC